MELILNQQFTEELNNRKFVGRLVYSVLTERRCVRDALKLFPDSMDKNIECAYHALVHFEADEDLRYQDIEYREAQNDYLEEIAQTLSSGKELPRNIIADYEDYYKGVATLWKNDWQGLLKEIKRFINI